MNYKEMLDKAGKKELQKLIDGAKEKEKPNDS